MPRHSWRAERGLRPLNALADQLLGGHLFAALFIAATLTAQASPLAAAQAALAADDTARAVRALLQVHSDTGMTSDDLAALTLLQWIGRSPSQRAARAHWVDQAEAMIGAVGRNAPARVLVYALLVDRAARDRAYEREFAGGGIGREFARYAESDDALLAGTTSWVLAVAEIRRFGRELPPHIPLLAGFPGRCPVGRVMRACTIRGTPPADQTLRALVAASDGLSDRLARTGGYLERAARAPWPVREFAVKTAALVEAFVGTPAGLRALSPRAESLPGRAAADLAVLIGEFSGHRGDAATAMHGRDAWYEPLDSALGVFGADVLVPDVFWRVAWPLFLEPYNARRESHRARLLLVDLLDRIAPGADQPFWLYGARENLVRRGVPRALVRVDRRARYAGGREVVVEYLDPDMYETVVRPGDPETAVALDLALAARDDYATVRAVTGYVPEYHGRIVPFPHQVVQYVRGGQTHVDLYARRTYPLMCEIEAPEVGLFLLDDRLGLLKAVIDSVSPRTRQHRFRLELDPGSYVYSLELFDRSCRHAARSRYVLEVAEPATSGLSDLVLAEEVRLDHPRRLVSAQPMTALPGLSVRAGGPVHFYWEVYGLGVDAAETRRLAVSLEVVDIDRERVGVSELAEIARAAARAAPTLRVEYVVPVPPGDGPLVMGLTVDMPATAHGVHLARLAVADSTSGAGHTAVRAFHVDPPVR